MAKQRQTKLPNLFRNPLMVIEFVSDVREMAEVAEKASAEEGRTNRDRPKFLRIKAMLREMEQNAEARLGDQLDG